ncbi:MAG: ATP-binding protein, partial [Clostridia bacterium]|nr:ATP-binding protein [Clostridia bacterium]
EFDMVIYNKSTNTCSIYEIKHSNKVVIEQAKHMLNEEKCNLLENKFGKITGKYVLYRGKEEKLDEVNYINVEQFLYKL